MSINEMLQKIKPYYYLLLILVLALIFLAIINIIQVKSSGTPIKISYSSLDNLALAINSDGKDVAPSGEVIGSKNGKKYYFPWCGTVKRIKPENQVHFSNIDEAVAQGYAPGGNCKGLK